MSTKVAGPPGPGANADGSNAADAAGGGANGGGGGQNKKKGQHECGDSGSYGKMKDNNYANGNERDHVPSCAALIQRANNLRGGNEICEAQENRVRRAASACAIPRGVHRDFSETCGNRNNPAQIAKDGGLPKNGEGGLQNAAKRDTAAVQNGLKQTNTSAECQKKYAEWAKEVNSRDEKWYDNMLKTALSDKKWKP